MAGVHVDRCNLINGWMSYGELDVSPNRSRILEMGLSDKFSALLDLICLKVRKNLKSVDWS